MRAAAGPLQSIAHAHQSTPSSVVSDISQQRVIIADSISGDMFIFRNVDVGGAHFG